MFSKVLTLLPLQKDKSTMIIAQKQAAVRASRQTYKIIA
jgi:hypothetical protein